MTFADLLAEYTRGRTIEWIVAECRTMGVEIHRIYLSRIRSGDRLPPADDKTIRAIACVCGKDPEPLVLLAKIERHPEEVLRLIMAALSEDGNPDDPKSLAELVARVKGLPAIRTVQAVPPGQQTMTVEVKLGGEILTRVTAQVGKYFDLTIGGPAPGEVGS